MWQRDPNIVDTHPLPGAFVPGNPQTNCYVIIVRAIGVAVDFIRSIIERGWSSHLQRNCLPSLN